MAGDDSAMERNNLSDFRPLPSARIPPVRLVPRLRFSIQARAKPSQLHLHVT
jgi:hypothetical protein